MENTIIERFDALVIEIRSALLLQSVQAAEFERFKKLYRALKWAKGDMSGVAAHAIVAQSNLIKAIRAADHREDDSPEWETLRELVDANEEALSAKPAPEPTLQNPDHA